MPVIPRSPTGPLTAMHHMSEDSLRSESLQHTSKDTAASRGSRMPPESSLLRRRLTRGKLLPVVPRILSAPLAAMHHMWEESIASESPRESPRHTSKDTAASVGSPRHTSKDTSLARRRLTKDSVEPIMTRRGSMTSRSDTMDEMLMAQQRSNGPSRSLATIQQKVPGRNLIEKTKAIFSTRLRRDSHCGTALVRRPVGLPSPNPNDSQSDSPSDSHSEMPLGWDSESEARGPAATRLSLREIDAAMEDAVASTKTASLARTRTTSLEYQDSFTRTGTTSSEYPENSYATLQAEPYSQQVLRRMNNKDLLEEVAKERFGADVLTLDCDTYKTAAVFEAAKGCLEAKIESLRTWRAGFLDESREALPKLNDVAATSAATSMRAR